MTHSLRQPGPRNDTRYRSKSSSFNIDNNDRIPFQFRKGGGDAQQHIKDQMGGTFKTHGNTIVGLNSEPMHQHFLQTLKKRTLDASGSDRAELGDIVVLTNDGRSMLRGEDQFVQDKINSQEDAETDAFKTWERLEATLKPKAMV
jgi:hypothetical protein